MSSEGPPAGDQTILKFIHITDPHLVRRGERVHGLDPGARLERCIGEINDRHEDAAFCVITGDLVHNGDDDGYSDSADYSSSCEYRPDCSSEITTIARDLRERSPTRRATRRDSSNPR